MPKLKKDKFVTFRDGKFWIETTVHQPGLRSRTLRGNPWIVTTPTDVRMGCIRFTHEAMREIYRCLAIQIQTDKPITHQVGNYGDPE